MGMQIYFNRKDCEHAQITRGECEYDWYIDHVGHRIRAWSNNEGNSFWFDCGSRSEHQMASIGLLIAMRVPFLAS